MDGVGTQHVVEATVEFGPVTSNTNETITVCWQERPTLQVGTVIAGYRLIKLLGKGGEGQVFSARSLRAEDSGQIVAIKLAPVKTVETQSFEPNVLAEAKLLMGVQHPGVVRVIRAGHVNGWDYSVMERIEGISLHRFMRRNGAIPLSVALDISIQICDTLAHLHGHGPIQPKQRLLHRDIKPSNVMLDKFGQVRLIDFGVACPFGKLDSPDTPVYGTPAYMAPEQITRDDVGPETDLFGVGVMLYEMVTGFRLFPEKNIAKLIADRVQSVSDADSWGLCTSTGHRVLDRILSRCTHPLRSRRYPCALRLGRALRLFRRSFVTGPTLLEYFCSLQASAERHA